MLTDACLECGSDAESGCGVHGGRVCSFCWQVLLRMATSRLCDQIIELTGRGAVHPITVSRVVATALPEPVDRLRVLFELKARGLRPDRAAGIRSDRLLGLIRHLAANDVPWTVLGQIRFPAASGFHGVCVTCRKDRRIVGRKRGDLLCGVCWASDERVHKPCSRCGQPDRLSRTRLCMKCRCHDVVRALFTAERLNARPQLRAARDKLLSADGPYLHNMMKYRTWTVLCQLVTGEQDITHEAVDLLLRPGVGMLRSFLVSTGTLPERNERLHSFEQWIHRTSESITGETDRRAFTGFARWRHLRRARTHELTEAQYAGQRRELAQIRALLDMLHSHRMSLYQLDQTTLDAWQAEGPFERWRVKPFLEWCRQNKSCRQLTLYTPPARPLPAVFRVSEQDRAAVLKRILDPEQKIDPGLRLAAGLVVLYGFRSHAIVSLALTDIIDDSSGIWIRLGHDPLRLPDELEECARQAIRNRRVLRFGGMTEDTQWLFPGPLQNRPITSKALRDRLRTLDVRPEDYRSTALGHIAQQLPSPVLARLTGLNPITAGRWNNAVSASHGRNLPTL